MPTAIVRFREKERSIPKSVLYLYRLYGSSGRGNGNVYDPYSFSIISCIPYRKGEIYCNQLAQIGKEFILLNIPLKTSSGI